MAHGAARAVEDLSIPLTSGPPAAADILAGTLPYRARAPDPDHHPQEPQDRHHPARSQDRGI